MKVINWILAALAAAALAFCGYSWYQYSSFPADSYAARAAELDEQTARIKEQTAQLQKELEDREEAVRADLAKAGEDGAAAAERLEAAQAARDEKQAELDSLNEQIFFVANIEENTHALRDEYAKKIRQLEDLIVAGESDVKICYWTLDDGPTYYTQSFLDMLKEQDVFVTFFTSREANQSAANDDPEVERALLRAETMAGHSVQNHTNSHQYAQYGNVYGKGIESFRTQVELQNDWILECTGFRPDIFRFPGGSAWGFAHLSKDEMLGVLEDLGYRWVDWSCDVADNLYNNPDAAAIAYSALYQLRAEANRVGIAIILSHDMNINTYYGLQQALPVLLKEGFLFLPLFSESWTIGNLTIQYS